jgi:PAT family beta-lactamase induction signal transducer AmpG
LKKDKTDHHTSQLSAPCSQLSLRWLPSLYFTKGLSQVVVMTLSVILYKQLGLTNGEITFYVAWLYLPWVIKPFWKPFVDRLQNRRWWILLTQVLLGAGIGGVAFTIQAQLWLQGSLCLFWLLAFASATHNEASDSLYRDCSSGNSVPLYALVRNLSQKAAVLVGQGVLVMLAGNIQVLYRNFIRYSWSLVFYVVAGLFLAFFLYHLYALPRGEEGDSRPVPSSSVWGMVREHIQSFSRQPNVGLILLLLLLFRLPEALLNKVSILFLIDSSRNGGLGLSPQEYGLVMGTVGILALSVGSVLGTKMIRSMLRHSPFRDRQNTSPLWWTACAMTLPDMVYVYLSYALPDSLLLVSLCVLIEQMGYGFGFTLYLHFVNGITENSSGSSHKDNPQITRSLVKALMALSFMLPTMIAGTLQMRVGYRSFFVIVVLLCVVTFVVTSSINRRTKFPY